MPHPLPTPKQVTTQWNPNLDNVTKLLSRIKPRPYPGALCAGKAPHFDRGRHDGETLEEFRERKQYIRFHCQRCPVEHCPKRMST